jgi:hypothetical protein
VEKATSRRRLRPGERGEKEKTRGRGRSGGRNGKLPASEGSCPGSRGDMNRKGSGKEKTFFFSEHVSERKTVLKKAPGV